MNKTNTLRILSRVGIAAALVTTCAASAPAWSYEGHGHDRWQHRGHQRHDARYDRRHYEHGHRGYVVERPVYVQPRTVYVERPVVIERQVSYPEPAYSPPAGSVLGSVLGSVFGLP